MLWPILSRTLDVKMVHAVFIDARAEADGSLPDDTQSLTSVFEVHFEAVDIADSKREVDHFNREAALIQKFNRDNYTAVQMLAQLGQTTKA